MQKPFLKFRDQFINLNAISYVEKTDDGGVAIVVQNREKPFRLDSTEARPFLELLSRFCVPMRGL